MNRFFYQSSQREGTRVLVDGEDAHHLLRVLRASTGDTVELCDEQGICHLSTIINLTKTTVLCELAEELKNTETQTKVELAFGLLKGEKTDVVLQKATELGVHRFLPYTSERTVVKGQEAKTERRQKIVRSAASQSHRSQVPQVLDPCEWTELITRFSDYDVVLLFWEGEKERSLTTAMGRSERGSRVLLITGPEGGLSKKEAEAARNAGAQIITLGPRILRAETAAITAAALVLYQAGEMGE